MILKNKVNEVEGDEMLGLLSKEATISQENMNKMWELIQDPYKNSIESIVREYTSNAVDANIEAKSDNPIIVKFSRDHAGYYISFLDNGPGMDEDRMDKIFLNVFASTKDKSNDMIGAFGMGSKAGISYNSYFEIITHVDGTTWHYIYKKGVIKPTLDLLNKQDETRENGTEFKVRIKNEEDLFKFAKACRNQLYYFTNVVFDYENLRQHLTYRMSDFEELTNNDYKIFDYKDFKFKVVKTKYGYNEIPAKEVHICNGPVKYPIDFNNIKSPALNVLRHLGVGIKFDIGELDVIQTREDVKYTDKTIQAIIQKAEKVEQYISDLYEEQHPEFTDDIEIYMKRHSSTLVLGKGEYEYPVSGIYPTVEIKYKPLHDISTSYNPYFTDFLFNGLSVARLISVGKVGKCKTIVYNRNIGYNYFDSNIRFAITKNIDNININKTKYLYFNLMGCDENSSRQYPILLDKRYKRKLADFKEVLGFSYTSVSNWRKMINIFIDIENKLLKKLTDDGFGFDYDTIKPDVKWLKDWNAKYYTPKAKADLTKMNIRVREVGTYNNNWRDEKRTQDEILNSNKFTIIAPHEDKDNLYSIESIYSQSKQNKLKYLELISIAPSHCKKIIEKRGEEFSNNIYTYDEFMENKNNIKFKFLGDLYIVYKLKYSFTYLHEFWQDSSQDAELQIGKVLPHFYKKYKNVKAEITKYTDYIKLQNNYYSSSDIKGKYEHFFTEGIDEIEAFYDIKKQPILKEMEDCNSIIKDFYVFLSGNGYHNKADTRPLSFYLLHYKPNNTSKLINSSIKKDLTSEDYELLGAEASLDLIDKIRMNIYEIKNNLKVKNYRI